MKKTDMILLGSILLIAGIAYLLMQMIINNSSIEGGTASVHYNDEVVLEIDLEDGSYTILNQAAIISIDEDNNIYTVTGTNGDVVIEYGTRGVRVIEETSPQHICKLQGWSKSPLQPLTCLPNNLIIIIKKPQDPEGPDDITS